MLRSWPISMNMAIPVKFGMLSSTICTIFDVIPFLLSVYLF